MPKKRHYARGNYGSFISYLIGLYKYSKHFGKGQGSNLHYSITNWSFNTSISFLSWFLLSLAFHLLLTYYATIGTRNKVYKQSIANREQLQANFGLFHLYIRVKCIIILYKRDGLGKLNITIPDSEKKNSSTYRRYRKGHRDWESDK